MRIGVGDKGFHQFDIHLRAARFMCVIRIDEKWHHIKAMCNDLVGHRRHSLIFPLLYAGFVRICLSLGVYGGNGHAHTKLNDAGLYTGLVHGVFKEGVAENPSVPITADE